MQRGLELEPEARKAFEAMTGEFVNPEFRLHPDIKWMGASFDGINESGVICEIKCPGKDDHVCAVAGKVPEKYMPQLQHQMYVAQVGQAYYFSYRPGDLEPCAIIHVSADREFQKKMIAAEKEFWDMVQSKTPPEPTDRDIQVREDRAWLMMEEELLGTIRQIEELEARKEGLRATMIEMCEGRATKGYRLKLSPIPTKGSIDYSKIEILKEIDLEQYRKPSSIRWRVDQV